tara:strand:+ start:9350 stop:9565 length:216 start_codon:yes stop_codon:yes gene_type:complete
MSIHQSFVSIQVFDDSRNKFKQLPNKWLILETKFDGGKLLLQNTFDKEQVITISTWKTNPYEHFVVEEEPQ